MKKPCTKCGKLTDEFGKSRSWCKSCEVERVRKWRANHQEKVREYGCKHARRYYAANVDKLKEYYRQRRSANLEKARERDREYYIANIDKQRERKREYSRRYRAENPDKVRECQRRCYIADAERQRERSRKWIKAHPEKKKEYAHKRRARKVGNGGKITAQEWMWLKEFYDFTCLCCGKQEPEIKLTLDHVVPLARGGKNTIGNAQPLCKSCNDRKHDKHIDYRKKTALL